MVAASYFYVYLISMVWFVLWRCRETGDLVAAMVVASLGVTSEIGPTKLIYMFIYRYSLQSTLLNLKIDSIIYYRKCLAEVAFYFLCQGFFYVLLSCRDKVRELVDKYLDCDALVKPGSRFSNNLMKILRGVKKRAMIFWVVIIGNGVVYILKPIILPGRHLMEDSFILFGYYYITH